MKKCGMRLMVCLMLLSAQSFAQQRASLTIKNKSDRHLTVKVMKGSERNAILYKTESIAPKGTQIIYFSETGTYFTKNQAILVSKEGLELNDTIYSKDRPIQVISDSRRGYSNYTMEFKVKETKKPDPGSAIASSRKEYEN